MTFLVKNFALASLAAATLVACGGGGDGGSSNTAGNSPTASANIFQKQMTVSAGDTWLFTGNRGNAPSDTETCLEDGVEAPIKPGFYKLEVVSGGGILQSTDEGICKEFEENGENLIFEVEEGIEVTFNANSPTPELKGNKTGNLKVIEVKEEDKVSLASLTKYLNNEFNGKFTLRSITSATEDSPEEGDAKATIKSEEGKFTLTLEVNGSSHEFLITDGHAGSLLAQGEDDKNDIGVIFISTADNSKSFTFDRTFEVGGIKKTGIYNFEISEEIYNSIAIDDPRYGNGGTVISKGTAFPLKDVPAGVTPAEAGYFLFEITNPENFATAQFYTAGKISQGDGKEGYDFTRFSVKTSDNWKTAEWSEVRFGKAFDNGNVLVTCQNPDLAGNWAGSDQTIVAISENAKVVTDYKFAYGKTLVEYSCGVDQEDWEDFTGNNKSPFEFNWETKIGADGKVVVDDNGKTVSVEDLFSKDGYREIGDSDGTDYETYATAYELNGQYYVLFKDRDEERDDNPSRYGVALGVFK